MSEGHVQLELVRKLMSLPADRREWSPDDWKLLRNRKAFISVESGQETSETVSQWNGLVPADFAIKATGRSTEKSPGFTDEITFIDRRLDAPYEATRDDAFVAPLTINELTKPEVETRLCRSSIGNSDLSFLPLRGSLWGELRTEFGDVEIDRHFARLPETFAAFEALLF